MIFQLFISSAGHRAGLAPCIVLLLHANLEFDAIRISGTLLGRLGQLQAVLDNSCNQTTEDNLLK